MGIYIAQPSSDDEDIQFMKELITTGKAYLSNGKIYRKSEDSEYILWEKCDKGVVERFPGDPGCLDTPWGYGRYTRDGYSFLFMKLANLGRTRNTFK